MSFRDALNLAQNQELDLVEVAPQAKPVVCRIMDYGKFRYEQDKRDKETRKKQRTITVKGVRLNSVRIGEHDFEVRRNQAHRFLEEGDKVKVSLRFRGREMVHRDLGRNMLLRMADELGELAIIESPPRMEGRTMVMVLAPSKDNKDK